MANTSKYPEEYERAWNAYFYPGTETFINKLDIKNQDELLKKEAELTFERLVELYENPLEGDFDKFHLCGIHEYLFQDLYDWAGKYRTVYMAKRNSYFTPTDDIDMFLEEELRMLNEDVKKIISKEEFIMLLAEYIVILLNIHPFREGNGRSIREFFREFTIQKTKEIGLGEYELDWSRVDGKAFDDAMQFARMTRSPIEAELRKAFVPIENEDIKKAGL